jgi:hypothetical protein
MRNRRHGLTIEVPMEKLALGEQLAWLSESPAIASLSEGPTEIRLLDEAPAGEFEWRWPSGDVEKFERSWLGRIRANGADLDFRHALGRRDVYGRSRVHSVTWRNGAPMVEGVEADDFSSSQALLSRLLGTARQVAERLDAFRGIGQKKAAMAVEILERDLHVPIVDMAGSGQLCLDRIRRISSSRQTRMRASSVVAAPFPQGVSVPCRTPRA